MLRGDHTVRNECKALMHYSAVTSAHTQHTYTAPPTCTTTVYSLLRSHFLPTHNTHTAPPMILLTTTTPPAVLPPGPAWMAHRRWQEKEDGKGKAGEEGGRCDWEDQNTHQLPLSQVVIICTPVEKKESNPSSKHNKTFSTRKLVGVKD